MAMLGMPLGVLIGIATGLAAVFLIRSALSASGDNPKTIVGLVAELLAIPTFWFGGPWVTTELLRSIDRDAMLPFYMLSLACVFVAIVIFPLLAMVVASGNGSAKRTGHSDG